MEISKKKQIRKTLKTIEVLSTEMDRGMIMDNSMDGSGECGGIIADGWIKWFNRRVIDILKTNGVKLSEILEVTNAWANRELEMGPKKIFIKWTSKHGMYKDVDYLDTKWGNLAMTLHNSTLSNC